LIFTEEACQCLLGKQENSFFRLPAADRYAVFQNVDPFFDSCDSLLSGGDVAKYALAAGILEPFHPEQLSGVTYSANFSGQLYYWGEDGGEIHLALHDGETYTIPPNSITYLEIDTTFRVPNYMALRFNLRVKNVYKGLLLGTGPIVDSGFVGRLFIPLHNLTSNSYEIKKGAKLIEVEFTKLSSRDEWKVPDNFSVNGLTKPMIDGWDFSDIPSIANKINAMRDFGTYIDSALRTTGFHVKDNGICVKSSLKGLEERIDASSKSISDTSAKLQEQQDRFKENFNQTSEKLRQDIQDALDKSEHRENFVKTFSILTILAMLVDVVVLWISAGSYFTQAADLRVSYQTLEEAVVDSGQSLLDILKSSGGSKDASTLLQDISEKLDKLDNQRQEQKDCQFLLSIPLYVCTSFSLFNFIVSICFIVHIRKTKDKNSDKSKAVSHQDQDI